MKILVCVPDYVPTKIIMTNFRPQLLNDDIHATTHAVELVHAAVVNAVHSFPMSFLKEGSVY